MDTEEVHIVDPTLDSMAMGSTSRLHLLHSTAGHRRTQITRMRGIQSTMIVRWGMEDTQEQDKDQEADIAKRDALDRGDGSTREFTQRNLQEGRSLWTIGHQGLW